MTTITTFLSVGSPYSGHYLYIRGASLENLEQFRVKLLRFLGYNRVFQHGVYPVHKNFDAEGGHV